MMMRCSVLSGLFQDFYESQLRVANAIEKMGNDLPQINKMCWEYVIHEESPGNHSQMTGLRAFANMS